MKLRILFLCAIMILSVQFVSAQHPQSHSQGDPLENNFFPPELVMHNQQAIGLTEEQKSFINGEIQKTHTRFTELQWQLASEMETMYGLVSNDRVDEQQALAQLDKIMALEREIKRSHFALVVRIKNRLTPEQQARLQEIKSGHRR